ncbi:CLUMA_CG007321, isoform A [Clunio marinus]|uniref:CLUMA_CG007321, isoform A n=1 Tax=Clunio marinus TaxID=568069 RepID=A0A1J1I5Y5_9DIPT|nr:CLUMA_CG007321, isoform A [Clunio marinus]
MANLVEQYKMTAHKLKKIQRVVFKKQDTKEIANEFTQLAMKLDNSFLSEYAGLCFLGVAKCNESDINDVESYLKAARMFRKADERKTKLGFLNNHEVLEGAYRSYFQALTAVDDPVMRTCIIREIKELNKDLNTTSDFNSASHRIYDLEQASNENIRVNDFIGALEKLTEIVDDVTERKVNSSYFDVMKRNEVSRLLLLLILELPPSRQSPSHIKLLEKYTWNHESFDIEMATIIKTQHNQILDENLVLLLETLVCSFQNMQIDCVMEICDELSKHHSITIEQKFLIDKLVEKFK